jgi:hypothetical protein
MSTIVDRGVAEYASAKTDEEARVAGRWATLRRATCSRATTRNPKRCVRSFLRRMSSAMRWARDGCGLPHPVPIRTTALVTQPSFGGTATNTRRPTHKNVDAHVETPKISGESNRAPLVSKLWKRRGIGPAGCANGEKVGGCASKPCRRRQYRRDRRSAENEDAMTPWSLGSKRPRSFSFKPANTALRCHSNKAELIVACRRRRRGRPALVIVLPRARGHVRRGGKIDDCFRTLSRRYREKLGEPE